MEQDIGFYRDSKSVPSVPREAGATAGEKAGRRERRGAAKLSILNSMHLADVSCFGPL